MKKYTSKVSPWIRVILGSSLAISWAVFVPVYRHASPSSTLIIFILLAAITLFIGHLYFHTYYLLDDEYVYWHSGFFKGKLPIKEIKSIRKAASPLEVHALIKPCLTMKPLLMKYNTYDELPVSPLEEEKFIETLKTINPNIVVKK